MQLKNKYVVATRPSLLATVQTEQTVNLLREKFPGIYFEIVKFSTHGDIVQDKPLNEFGGTGVFVKELEMAIDRGEADFAVHSLKDVPGIIPSQFVMASYPRREDPRDVILTNEDKTLDELAENCIIGTSSPRRILQVSKLKPGAIFKDIRGNIDTRLRKLNSGEFNAIVLAAAGLKRLGKPIPEKSFQSVDLCLPAIGQGIIGLECRKDDIDTIEMLRSINHNETEIAAKAERKFMFTIGGGCKFPLAAYAVIKNEELTLYAMIGNHNTREIIHKHKKTTIDKAEECGETLANTIKAEAEKLSISFL